MPSWKLKTIELEPYSEKLEPGDRALLGFCVGSSAFVTESVWVRVFAQLHDGKAYLGTVECAPSSIPNLGEGDQVTFQQQHIIEHRKASGLGFTRYNDDSGGLN